MHPHHHHRYPRHKPPRQQRGIAILTVLVIAVLIVTLAAVIFARQSRAVRQNDNYQSLERAWQYAYTLEQYAGIQLQRDFKANKYDALGDRWTYKVPAQTVTEDSGAIVKFTGRLEDLQARFNINNLLDEKGKLRTTGEDAYLKELIRQAGLPASFLSVIIDWMDSDSQIQNGDSAERDYYLAGNTPFNTADMPFTDPSELRLLRLDTLEPKAKEKALDTFTQTINTLPSSVLAKTTINANTASQEVLNALGLSKERVAMILAAQKQKLPYKTQDELINALTFNPQDPTEQTLMNRIKQQVDVKSSFFLLTGEIQINRARVFLNSVLFREPDGKVRVIMRQFDRVNTKSTTTNDASTTPANTN
jgi:general secretion pathway protein K